METKKSTYRVLVGKAQWKEDVGIRLDNIKMAFRDRGEPG